MIRHRVSVGGCAVHVADTGPRDGPVVLMLHGNPDTHTVWDGVVGALAGEGHRILRPDMPGFGRSSEPPAAFDYRPGVTVPLWTQLLARLGACGPVTVVVHDFGGPWLLPWVARHPERVHGLVVCSAPFHPSFRWHVWARVWQTLLLGELAAWGSTRGFVRHEMRRGSKRLPVAYCDRVFDELHPAMQRSVLRTYRSHRDPVEVFTAEAARLEVDAAAVPTRVIWGARDPYLPVDQARTFGRPVELLDEVGHWTPVEAPDVVARAIRAVRTEATD